MRPQKKTSEGSSFTTHAQVKDSEGLYGFDWRSLFRDAYRYESFTILHPSLIPDFDAGAFYCPRVAALHAARLDDQTEGSGVRARLLEYAARRASEVNNT
jgi:hypothetical protein